MASSALGGSLFDFEYSLTGSYCTNVLSDSSDVTDRYGSDKFILSAYPFKQTRINLTREWTRYRDLWSIGNDLMSAEVTAVPLGDTAGTAIYLSTSVERRDYESDSLNFNSTDQFKGMISAGHRFSPTSHGRLGASFKTINYRGSGIESKKQFEIFAGAYLGLIGSASFDFEAGYSTGNFIYVDSSNYLDSLDRLPMPPPVRRLGITAGKEYNDRVVTDGSLKSFYIAPRLSMSLGRRTGLKLTFSHRSFVDLNKDSYIYGFSIPVLSPWSSDYEGQAVTLTAKSFVVPHVILSGGIGYFHKDYIDHLEEYILRVPGMPEQHIVSIPWSIRTREDKQTRLFAAVQVPFASRSGWFQGLIEPSFQVEYNHNNSTIEIYDYDAWTVSLGLKVKI